MLINKLTSTFGDHSNLIPLFTKDVVNSTGMTAFSYDAGGKIEAKDRFIDEFGTQAHRLVHPDKNKILDHLPAML